jgi:hypothetical protein
MKALVVAILLALTLPASAQDTNSANFILPGCKGLLTKDLLDPKDRSYYEQPRCLAFITGAPVYGARGKDFCEPNGVTIGQVVAVVVKYIEARPERMHEDFGTLALEALTAAWPCKR